MRPESRTSPRPISEQPVERQGTGPLHHQHGEREKPERPLVEDRGARLLRTDEEGFLEDPADWDRAVAQAIAEQEGLTLDPARWRVVEFVRQHYEINQTVPEARTVLRHLRDTLGAAQATRKYLQTLFPYGYGQQACKIAGMIKPRKLMLDV